MSCSYESRSSEGTDEYEITVPLSPSDSRSFDFDADFDGSPPFPRLTCGSFEPEPQPYSCDRRVICRACSKNSTKLVNLCCIKGRSRPIVDAPYTLVRARTARLAIEPTRPALSRGTCLLEKRGLISFPRFAKCALQDSLHNDANR